MTPEETGQLLARAALIDNRSVDAPTVIAWHEILRDLPYPDCEVALAEHRAESTEWLMPAHIRRRVRESRNQRIQDAGGVPAPPAELIDNPAAYSAALRAAATALADGHDPHVAMQAIARQAARLELEAS
jgi:hypothetical protein